MSRDNFHVNVYKWRKAPASVGPSMVPSLCLSKRRLFCVMRWQEFALCSIANKKVSGDVVPTHFALLLAL